MIDRIARRTCPGWGRAERHLSRVEPKLATVIARVGPCTLAPRRDYFASLCHAIIAQQISTPVARVIFARFRRLFPRLRPTAAKLGQLPTARLRQAGLSRQKISYLKSLAKAFCDGAVPTRRFSSMSDEQIIAALLPLRGVGRWTAEMFLIFVLTRNDVLPVDDLGLRKGVQRLYGLRRTPSAAAVRKRARAWRPYCSIATWYLWRMTS